MPEESKIYTLRLDDLSEIKVSEIGLLASSFHTIDSLNIYIPNGFVITASAFEDFLIANDMVSEIHAWLKTLNGANMSDINKASERISELFKNAVIPTSIFESIRQEYASLARMEETMVNLSLSWIPELKNLTGGIDKKYSFEGICGINELEKIIKIAWQAPFDSNAIFERIQQGYSGNISIGLVIKKTIASEVSGKLYSFNPLTNNQNQQEIQAVLGLWKGIDVLEIIPDHYIVNKQNEAIEEKNVMTQSNMLLKKGFIKLEENERFIQIGISKAWQIRQKISDKLIQDLAAIGKTLEDKFGQTIELDWGFEAGKIYITNIKFLPRVRHQNSLSFNPNIVKREDYKVGRKPVKVEIVNEPSEKSLDEYVDEIESQIADIDSVGWDKEEDFEPKIAQKHASKKKKKITKKAKIEEIHNEEVDEEPIEQNIYHSVNYGFLFKEKTEIVTKVFIDISEKFSTKNLNSDSFDGVLGIKGENIVKGYGVNLSKAKADILQGFIDYGVEQLMQLIEKDKQKDYIYSLSNLTLNEAIKYTGISYEGLNLHLNSTLLLELELEILRIIRNKKNFRRIWFNINRVNQVSDYKYFKNILDSHTLRKSPSFRFFMEIDQIPPFLNINDYIDEGLNGVIIDLDQVLKLIIGTRVSETSILKNDLFWNMMQNISKQAENRKIPVILNSKIITESEEILQKFLKTGVYGITVNPDKVLTARDILHKVEVQNLS